MTSVNSLAARFYQLKSGHTPTGVYLKRFSHRDDDNWWWCGGTVAQMREHLVLEKRSGNPPAVRVRTGKIVRFGSRTDQQPDPQPLGGQARTSTRQPAGFAGFGYTCRFQSPVLCFCFFYLWLHLDTLLLIAKY